ncbi:TPA_exp: putative Glycosyl transferase [Trichophyton benhamiae CBS 112371]|nr:TPA_exp: putative Glycosyl transferase [Trichophyton benhamiae CBS 112371]
MRRGLLIFLLINTVIILFLVRSVFTLLTLLVEDATDDAIQNVELPGVNSSLIDLRPQLIPKIIHQTYKNESIPEIWVGPRNGCIEMHPDYEYILWTDKKSRDFIAEHYPWFLTTFDNYPFPIQRADSIRYFILAHYGGTYIDLDDKRKKKKKKKKKKATKTNNIKKKNAIGANAVRYMQGCNRRLDPLLSYPAWVRRTAPTGISNDAMGSVPNHPFFLRVIKSLQAYDRAWVLPYITVMYSTGPLFLSVIWKEYKNTDPDGVNRVRVLLQDAYNRHSWSFFTHHPGSSWHGEDAQLIFWMGSHWMLITFSGFLAAGIVGLALWRIYRRVLSLGSKHARYTPLASGTSSPRRSLSPSRRKMRILPLFFQRSHAKKEDEEIGPDSPYELGNR